MKIERIHFAGWEDCVQLTHGDMNLIVTTAVGPRIIYCALKDKGNLFYVNYDQAGSSGGEEWKTYGGHRFWCAPEDLDFTYAPDNAPVQVIESGHGVRLTAPVEKSGVMKTIEISPVAGQNRVRLEHIVQNMGRQTLRLAPWALSVMCTGGVAVIPHNLERPHDLLPTHSLSLWGYTDPGDPRWQWGKRYILLRQDPAATNAQKTGLQNPYGWAGYAVRDQFFMKRFAWDPTVLYPDFNCNFEVYTNPDILELESLAPLVELPPGKTATHWEEWTVYDGIPAPQSEEDVDRTILPLV